LTPELGGHIASLAGQINAHREGEGWRGVKVPARPSAKLHATASISFGAKNSGNEHSNADGVESNRI
jgi:hypothetical protein